MVWKGGLLSDSECTDSGVVHYSDCIVYYTRPKSLGLYESP